MSTNDKSSNNRPATGGTTTGAPAADKDRRAIYNWVFAIAVLVGIWVIAPMISTFIALATSGRVSLTMSRPDEVTGPEGVEITGLAADIPVEALGDSAKMTLTIGTIMQFVVVLIMVIIVDLVLRRLRPGRTLTNRTKVSAMAAVIIAGIVGLIAMNIVTSAGVHACQAIYESCSDGRTWDNPMTTAFPLVGLGLALVMALARSEFVARTDSEGLI